MAKDKNKQTGSAGDSIDRDTSIDATSQSESDSELDIHALLRKYMPDYETEDTEPTGSVLRQLKQSESTPADKETKNAADSEKKTKTTDLSKKILTNPSEDAPNTDAAEYDFTDDLPVVQSTDAYELEDEEGIYEDDVPQPKKKAKREKPVKKAKTEKKKRGLFARRDKTSAYENDDTVLPPENLFTNEEDSNDHSAVDSAFPVMDTAPADEIGDGVMNSMDIPEAPISETVDMPLTDTVPQSKPTEEAQADADSFENSIDLDAIAASLSLAEEKTAENASDAPKETEDFRETVDEAEKDDSFDPTDINLMVAFGMDEDGDKSARKKTKKKKNDDTDSGETREQKAARQVGDRLEAEQVGARKVKLEYPEYMDRSQTPEIQKRYRAKLIGLYIKLGLCGIFTVLLLVFENMEVLGRLFTGTAKQFGGVFDPAVYPTVYAMVSLQLMLLACVFAWEQIYDGLRNLFRGTPKPESLTALLTFAGIAYTAMIARITVQSEEPVMFNFVIALAAFMTICSAIYNTKREMLGFQVVSSPKPKHIVVRVPDDESRCETGAFAEDENICDVMRIEKTDFVDGFFTRLYTPDPTTNLFMSCAMGIVVALSVLFGVFTGVRGGSGVEIARVVIVSLCTMAPLSVFLGFAYPFWRANMASRDYDSTIIGESSLTEYANASIVTFDDKNVFPSYSVKVQNIRIYNNARIDRVMYYAASVFAKAGGPLQDVFEVATIEMGHSDNVNIFDTDRGFLAAEVDGVNILFGSAKALAERGLKIPRTVFDEDADMSDELSIMYMFREDRLVAKMYIQYVMDGDIELILGQFQNSGLYVCVRTFDPNIDERMIARKVNMKRIPLKVVRYASTENETAEKASSGLVTCGSPKSLLQVISYCDKVLHTKKTNIALYVLAMLIGAAVMVLLTLSGSIGVMTSLYIALYQLLWLVPMLVSSKMFIR